MELSPLKLHLFNAFHSPYGGSELETLGLSQALSNIAETTLWAASSRGSHELVSEFKLRRTRPIPSYMPDGGHYIFVGTHWRGKCWPWLAKPPQRLIYIYNTLLPGLLTHTAKVPPRWPKPEYVAISQFQCQHLGIEAQVHPSPIDIKRFWPKPKPTSRAVRVGRISRDTVDKHHPEDLAIYQSLAAMQVPCYLQGGACLKSLQRTPGVHLWPAGKFDAAEFLQSLDIFYYRTSDQVVETFGRVVIEAMACGLPVVCHRNGGYADWIEHDVNGLLFDTSEQALTLLKELVADPQRRARLGKQARLTVEKMYSSEAIAERLNFYVKPSCR
ncbi:glycosyltransferase family 4 protein [Gilvimarinus sp. DA14]|uniref:glycosyltransferase family 4 protein n=1 Tax=Gilvimarinus sp. DA14 TaxID=2956798 RepID=UPI0020B7150F|nr:glycosyltransferase family 4 protein [Gilvimarinus sp. DA14]UTF61673.1 glycosyltransferase family 4 protein [Gilvimarinus sp. DA14]